MTEEQQPAPRRRGAVGKNMTYLGVIMFAVSIVLGFTDVGGAGFHNFLQFGGIAFLLLGYIVWKVLKL